MCEPTTIAVGMAIGAASSAATGNDPLMGAVMGGVTAGLMPAPVPVPGMDSVVSTGFMSNLGNTVTQGFFGSTFNSAIGMSAAQAVGLGVSGVATGIASNYLFPKTPEYNAQSYGYSPIAYNSQQNTVTGSGGAQAPALLASEIKRIKDVRKRQEGVRSPSLNIESFDQTGLQLA